MDKNILEEVSIFLKNYERAANSRDFDQVTPYISDDAIFWFTDGTFAGKEAIRQAFQNTWSAIENETYTISGIQWLVASDAAAACIYTFTSDGTVSGKRQIYTGHDTNVLRKSNGGWQIVHEHLSKAI